MNLGITGSRSIDDASFVEDVLNHLYKIYFFNIINSGGAVGVDSLAENWARENQMAINQFLPDYKCYGKEAPLVRNRLIVDSSDRMLAIWDGESKGTAYTIRWAQSHNIPVDIYVYSCL